MEIGGQACRRLYDTGTITIGNAVLDRIAQLGWFESWENVIVQASIRFTLRVFDASIKRSTGKVLLPTGTHCDLTLSYCIDADGAEAR